MVTFVLPATLGVVLGAVVSGLGAGLIPAISLGVVSGAVLLALEAWLLIVWSERRYERFDITSEKITEGE